MSGGLGIAGLLLGLCLLTNLNKAADGLARAIASEKPMGVDYSASFMAKPSFARLFGLMFVVVGTLCIFSIFSGPRTLPWSGGWRCLVQLCVGVGAKR